ncbi:MAG: UDP-N-acetylmuramoyl-L-alanyl-D-glutamate--2,6-diaminopimelate ligase [[Chlorobium] sp. 445]|nr:MAG: UDP-N-acetylmuramoyl-L-alanyl-D-glutamate--2,6-diaminopimelate ligase [[Chlorobium] sp. 445]
MTLNDVIELLVPVEMATPEQVAQHGMMKIESVAYDSRKVKNGTLFVAIKGFKTDGHLFIDKAVQSGASVVVCEELPMQRAAECVYLRVESSRRALARLAKAFYGDASDKLTIIGVTGTNGKTTTTFLIKSILDANGIKSGLIGTIEYQIGNEVIEAERTTPEALELHEFFDKMINAGCTHCVMEVSSHSLALHRTDGICFQVGVFTNLSRDHLDFHGAMENYFNAKKILFDGLDAQATAVTNWDDPYGKRIVSDCRAAIISYSVSGEEPHGTPSHGDETTLCAKVLNYELGATSVMLSVRGETHIHAFGLIGKFNLYNILAAYGATAALGLSHNAIVHGISKCKGVRGRMEQIWSKDHRCAIVDYAHSPDALENVMRAIREVMPKEGKLITVFGCGGERDKGKRPQMGRLAEQLSDIVILTSDNPRGEDPETILDDIEAGMSKSKTHYRIAERQEAIKKGIELLQQGDVLLVAGKGHETYQDIQGVKYHFDDRELIEKFFKASG